MVMRYPATKVQRLDARYGLPFTTLARKSSFFARDISYRNLNALVQGWFNILTHEENNDVNIDGTSLAHNIPDSDESNSLQHLEDCANATRGTEAYSQDEWIEE